MPMRTFKDLLKTMMDEKKPLMLTFGEKLAFTCLILEIHDDYIKINQLAFNKLEKQFTPTSSRLYVPLSAILFAEEPRG